MLQSIPLHMFLSKRLALTAALPKKRPLYCLLVRDKHQNYQNYYKAARYISNQNDTSNKQTKIRRNTKSNQNAAVTNYNEFPYWAKSYCYRCCCY
jgi:heat shock protein HspQ